ncbi:MAG: hypothetical protein M1816_005317 [Peltula sp. TS41687]|nr:MAG: hypothetical protein M1816_005317 [Peltula sp. TS41687]
MASSSTSSNGPATTNQYGNPRPTSTTPQTSSHDTTTSIQVGQERLDLIDEMKLIHHSLGLAIVGLERRESREEIVPLLHAIRDSNEILQRQLHMILSDPRILLGYPHPMYEFPHGFDQCVYHLGSTAEGPKCTASDQAFKEKPKEHLDFVHKHLADWPHPIPRIQEPIDLTLPDISPDMNPQPDTSDDLDITPYITRDITETTAVTASSHQSTEDALELLNLQISMEDIVETTTEPEATPNHELPYTDSMGRPISPAAYAWQNNLPYDSDFDEAMEYDSGEPMEAPREWFRPPIPEYQGTDNTATDPRFNEEYYSPPDDTDDF